MSCLKYYILEKDEELDVEVLKEQEVLDDFLALTINLELFETGTAQFYMISFK